MRIFSRTTKGQTDAVQENAPEHEEPAAQAAKWTNGSRLGARGVSILLGAAIACGPVGLVTYAVTGGGPSEAAPRSTSTEQSSPLQQSAGSFASGFVGAWLSASRADSAALDSYTSASMPTLPEAAFRYRDMAVASTVADGDLVQVVVAVNVKDDTVNDGKGDQWPRRYYQVTVSDHGGKLTAVGWPAPVSGPGHSADSPDLGYSQSVTTSSAAGKAVSAFLSAYLTGQGETEPYTSPSTSIPAIDPAPYSKLTVTSLQAVSDPAEHPSDGTTVQVYATVTAANSVGQQVTAAYPITLRARADRWEVFALGTTPVLSDPDADPVASSTATPTSTEGN